MQPYLPRFPNPQFADETGLVAVTHAINPKLILAAYSQGIFPWHDPPVHWYSPQPRAIFLTSRIHLPSNLPKLARQADFIVTFDQAFEQVINQCATSHAHEGVWISSRFIDAYTALHHKGFAHSVEVWQQNQLVGGLYGVQLGALFSAESMFYKVKNASKVAFGVLMKHLKAIGIDVVDAQVINQHTANLGAFLLPRQDYLRLLPRLVWTHCTYAGCRWPRQTAAMLDLGR